MLPSPILRAVVLAGALLAARPAGAQVGNPDFDRVTWTGLGCTASPLTADTPRASVDLVGDAASPAAYVGLDATYLYFRYRVNGDPSGANGFDHDSAWAMLVQVPSGNPYQYQYQLALNGQGQGGDTVEVWANNVPEDLVFDPLFTDEPETRVFRQVYDVPGPTNTTPLARSLAVAGLTDPTDYFVDVAFPISALVASGLAAADLPGALFYPVTATRPERHDKDHLACRFVPPATVTLDAAVTPALILPKVTTPVRYTIALHDTGATDASGMILTGSQLPSYLSNIRATVSADAPDVAATIVSTSPIEVRVSRLPAGSTVTLRIDADASPTCSDASATTALASAAINVAGASATATLQVDTSPGAEVCDGVDNNCDGRVDEGGAALCDDRNACTTDTCNAAAGCGHVPIPGCTPCATGAECNDRDGCTTDGCIGGRCIHTPVARCVVCTTAAECVDGDPCTTELCGPELVCLYVARPACVPCTTRAECDDRDPCTADQCATDGTCNWTAVAGCRRCATVADCADGKSCTEDFCTGGVCAWASVADCTECTPVPEVCDNGIDDDCDGLVDCADGDCAAAQACVPKPTEICGNCIDDEGDGLVDYEDPDCCAASTALTVGRLTLKPGVVRARGNQLRLEAEYANSTPALFDPLRQDTSVQLSDGTGPVLCATVPAARWRRLRRLTFRFQDRTGAAAGGLQTGEFRINRSGTLLFRARGRDVGIRPIDGSSIRLTVRVGRQCSQASMALRAGRKGLVFP